MNVFQEFSAIGEREAFSSSHCKCKVNFPVLNSNRSPLPHERFLAEVNHEPSRYLSVSPPPSRSLLNLSLLPRDFPTRQTLQLCGCNQGAPRSAGHGPGSKTKPRVPVTRRTAGPGPLCAYPGCWRNWSVRRKALWNFHLRSQVLGSKLGDTQVF